ncbi:YveK family protein [Clostridium sp. HCP1S3_B4]|uniref:YveK family protein n=1 Tax=unclassified Clostridium TaxID=2614128 RepID=UPI00168DC551|nr:Wzz/FepE/Etk N-terminal domain-containing protein [Clostridiales bacterium]MDY2729602.1 Wzz/FepE/Etk N-terminal domain-containing protein [Clostridium sp.]NLK24396.1 capsular biosynthesis protein [Clostridiales bacterium]
MNEESIKIQDIVDALKKKWQLIVSITLASTILVTIVSFFLIKPKYEANTKLFIGKESSASTDQNYNSNDVQMYQKLLKTYSVTIATSDLVERAFEDAGIDVDANKALAGLTVTPQTDTQILEISYTSENKEECKDVVQAITDEFIKTSPELITNANVKVIEEVKLPTAPVSPNKKLNIAVGFLLGLAVGVGIALLLAIMDSTFKDKEQLEQVMGLPVLGVIPDTEKVK